MKFLCLHGMGTNSDIFKSQLNPILAQLDPSHEYVFVDGLIECEPADGVEAVYPGPFYAYYSKPTADQLQAAYELIYEVIEEEGPFQGVMGFSQGAALAASMLIHHRKTYPHDPDLFQVAVFHCASLPFDLNTEYQIRPYGTIIHPQTGSVSARDWLPGDKAETTKANGFMEMALPGELALRQYHPEREYARIPIPTAHIIGKLDRYGPQSRVLPDLCGDYKGVLVHDLDHRLPRDAMFARKAANIISTAIGKAMVRY